MQVRFSILKPTVAALDSAFSPARIARYVKEAGGDQQLAFHLYRWNAEVSQSLSWPLHALEVVTRNAISRVITEKFGSNWHMEPKLLRMLDADGQSKLNDAVTRQRRKRLPANLPEGDPIAKHLLADWVVPELSFGFWTSLLTHRYEVPIGWTRRLATAFPYMPAGSTRQTISRPMDDARNLRNRISHHEPLLRLKLPVKHREIMNMLEWACPETKWYIEQYCTFFDIWNQRPVR